MPILAPQTHPTNQFPSTPYGGVEVAPVAMRTVPRVRSRWTWMMSPVHAMPRQGRMVPALVRAWWTPGEGGNLPAEDCMGEGQISRYLTQGFVVVPERLEGVTAFGQPMPATYVHAYRGRSPRGVSGLYWVDAWTRLVALGGDTVVTEYDREGYGQWLDALAAVLWGKTGPHDEIRKASTRSARTALQFMESQQPTPGRQAQVDDLRMHLDGPKVAATRK